MGLKINGFGRIPGHRQDKEIRHQGAITEDGHLYVAHYLLIVVQGNTYLLDLTGCILYTPCNPKEEEKTEFIYFSFALFLPLFFILNSN